MTQIIAASALHLTTGHMGEGGAGSKDFVWRRGGMATPATVSQLFHLSMGPGKGGGGTGKTELGLNTELP
jgi:hypothetical protein